MSIQRRRQLRCALGDHEGAANSIVSPPVSAVKTRSPTFNKPQRSDAERDISTSRRAPPVVRMRCANKATPSVARHAPTDCPIRAASCSLQRDRDNDGRSHVLFTQNQREVAPARPLRGARRDGEKAPGNRGPVAHPRAPPSTTRFHFGQRRPAVSRPCFGGRLLGTTSVERSGSGRCTWLHPEAEELGWKVEDQ